MTNIFKKIVFISLLLASQNQCRGGKNAKKNKKTQKIATPNQKSSTQQRNELLTSCNGDLTEQEALKIAVDLSSQENKVNKRVEAAPERIVVDFDKMMQQVIQKSKETFQIEEAIRNSIKDQELKRIQEEADKKLEEDRINNEIDEKVREILKVISKYPQEIKERIVQHLAESLNKKDIKSTQNSPQLKTVQKSIKSQASNVSSIQIPSPNSVPFIRSGIFNPSNLCYLNSTLQSLYSIYSTAPQLFESWETKTKSVPGEIIKLFKIMTSGSLVPEKSIRAFADFLHLKVPELKLKVPNPGKKTFGYVQSDPTELISLTFDKISEDPLLKNVLNFFRVTTLSPNIPETNFLNITVQSSILKGIEINYNKGSNPITELSPILMVKLNRLYGTKNNSFVNINKELDLKKYCTPELQKKLNGNLKYRLQSIIMHHGTSSGHYKTYTKDISSGLWLQANDSDIMVLDEKFAIETAQGDGSNNLNGYVFIYVREDMI